MSFWCLHLNSYTTNFWDKKVSKYLRKIAIARGGGLQKSTWFMDAAYCELEL